MRKSRLVTSIALALLAPATLILPLSGCSDPETAKARAAARALTPPAPKTNIDIAKDAYSKSDFPKALDYFERAAREGDANAEYYAGVMLSVGDGARRNPEQALKHFEAAAEKEQPDALYMMGRKYLVGDGMDRDPNKALALFDRAVLAYPPGEAKDKATEQRDALAKVLEEQSKTASADTAAKK